MLQRRYAVVSAILFTIVAGCAQRAPNAVVPTTAQAALGAAVLSGREVIQKTSTRHPLVTVTLNVDTKGLELWGASPSDNAFVSVDPSTGRVLTSFAPPVSTLGTVANPFGLTSFSLGGHPAVLFTTQIGEPFLGRMTFERKTLLRASYCRFANQLSGGIAPNPSSDYYSYADTPRHIVGLTGGDLVEVAFHDNKPCTTTRFFHDPLAHPHPFGIVYNPENHNVYVGDGGHILEIGQNHKLIKDFVLPGAGKSTLPIPTAMIYVPSLHGIAFENPYNSTIGGITTRGKLIAVHVPKIGIGTTPYSMAVGSDGTIWAAGGSDSFFRLGATSNELKYGTGYRVAQTESVTPQLTGIVTVPITPSQYKVYVTDAKNPVAYSIHYP